MTNTTIYLHTYPQIYAVQIYWVHNYVKLYIQACWNSFDICQNTSGLVEILYNLHFEIMPKSRASVYVKYIYIYRSAHIYLFMFPLNINLFFVQIDCKIYSLVTMPNWKPGTDSSNFSQWQLCCLKSRKLSKPAHSTISALAVILHIIRSNQDPNTS